MNNDFFNIHILSDKFISIVNTYKFISDPCSHKPNNKPSEEKDEEKEELCSHEIRLSLHEVNKLAILIRFESVINEIKQFINKIKL